MTLKSLHTASNPAPDANCPLTTILQIEFPSILLPPDIHSGSIVDINVARNLHAETLADQKFAALQSDILSTFGSASPSPPVLRCRNVTQTSIVLEWDPIQLATAELRSLSLYRNGTKAGVIPRDKLSTKISGLGLDTEYTFHLVLRTSAGQYSSERVTVKTHKMTDLSGITITPGIMPPPLRESLEETVEKIGAKMIESVRIDTTHFICTEPRGQAWEKAVEMNVPVVVPDWVKGCEREGRVVGVRGYYLDADPKLRQIGPGQAQSGQSQGSGQRLSVSSAAGGGQQGTPRIEHTPPTPERPRREEREVQGQGQGGGEAEPPAPPPKATTAAQPEEESEGEAEAEGGGYEAVGSSNVAQKEVSDDDEHDDEEDDSDDDAAPAKDKEKMPHDSTTGDKKETSERDAAKVAEEDGKFDEVAL